MPKKAFWRSKAKGNQCCGRSSILIRYGDAIGYQQTGERIVQISISEKRASVTHFPGGRNCQQTVIADPCPLSTFFGRTRLENDAVTQVFCFALTLIGLTPLASGGAARGGDRQGRPPTGSGRLSRPRTGHGLVVGRRTGRRGRPQGRVEQCRCGGRRPVPRSARQDSLRHHARHAATVRRVHRHGSAGGAGGWPAVVPDLLDLGPRGLDVARRVDRPDRQQRRSTLRHVAARSTSRGGESPPHCWLPAKSTKPRICSSAAPSSPPPCRTTS